MKKILFTLFLVLASVTAVSAQSAKQKTKTETETVTYVVNMHCENCVNKLTDNLSFIKGVEDFKISLAKKTISLKFDPSKVEEKTFVETIEKLGYTATKQEDTKAEKKSKESSPAK